MVEIAPRAADGVLVLLFGCDIKLAGSLSLAVSLPARQSGCHLDGTAREDADRANSSSSIEITGDPGNLVIRPSQEPRRENSRVTYNLQIAVPKGAQVEIRGQGVKAQIIPTPFYKRPKKT